MSLRGVVSLLTFAALLVAQEQPARVARPKLVVLCSIDQLASWSFAEAMPHFRTDGGFRRLLDQGVHFRECAYAHACSETGPGHATIGTGAPARAHGIVKNEWYDRDKGGMLYCAGEPEVAAVPEFPEGKGRSAARLCVPTIGDLMRKDEPRRKVVGLAHKDRSAILMAGKDATAVAWFERATGRHVTNSAYGAKAPSWLVELAQQKIADRWFGWEWTRFGPEAAYEGLVDDRPFEAPHVTSGQRTLPCTLRGGRGDEPSAAFYTEVFLSPVDNELVLEATKAAVRGEALGQDEHTDLLCVSFSANDAVGHYFGPDSVEARDILLRTDELLARFLAFLDESVGEGKYAFVLTSDHGVALPPEVAKERGLGGGRGLLQSLARAAAERALRERFPTEAKGAFVLHAGEWSLVLDRKRIASLRGELTEDAAFREACAIAAAAVDAVRGLRAGVPASDVRDATSDEDPIRRALAFACHERVGDVLLVPEPYWIEATLPASHGTPHEYDRRVPFLAMGPMLRRGHVDEASVTPGLGAVLTAHWIGLEPPKAAIDVLPQSAFVR